MQNNSNIPEYPEKLPPEHFRDDKAYAMAEDVAEFKWQQFNERQLILVELAIRRLEKLKRTIEKIKAGYKSTQSQNEEDSTRQSQR